MPVILGPSGGFGSTTTSTGTNSQPTFVSQGGSGGTYIPPGGVFSPKPYSTGGSGATGYNGGGGGGVSNGAVHNSGGSQNNGVQGGQSIAGSPSTSQIVKQTTTSSSKTSTTTPTLGSGPAVAYSDYSFAQNLQPGTTSFNAATGEYITKNLDGSYRTSSANEQLNPTTQTKPKDTITLK